MLAAAFAFVSPVAQAKQIKQLTGQVDKGSYYRFLQEVAKSSDSVIGVKVNIVASGKDDVYLAAEDATGFVVSTTGDRYPGYEAVIHSARYEHGDYIVDGFFLVKSGGTHQGITSYGLSPVNEAQIRLSSAIKIKEIKIDR